MQEPFSIHTYCVKPSFHYDANAKEAFNLVLQKNIRSPTSYAQPLKDTLTLLKVEAFFRHPPIDNLNLLPHEWWGLIRTNGCINAPITHNNLVQVCSMELCKRN
jgi:hypothetical protein